MAAETQAVFPSAVLLNIFNLLGLAEEILTMILGIVAIVVLLYLFVAMYSATLERKREITTMRALGARRTTILSIVLLESCAITAIGGIAGLHGAEISRLTFAQLAESIKAELELTQKIKSYSGKEVESQGFIIPACLPDLSFLLQSRVSALGNYCCEVPVG